MGMTKANRYNQSIKDRFADTNKGKQSMTIGEYLEKRDLRMSFPANCTDGIVKVNVNGVWVSQEDFNKLYPRIIVPTFNHDITNIDQTRRYLYE